MSPEQKQIRRLQREVSLLTAERDLLQQELDNLRDILYAEEQQESMWDSDLFPEELLVD